MKKLCLLLVISLLLLGGCGKNSVPKMEDFEWVMTSVQSNEDGQVIAFGERGSSTFDSAEQVELTCQAESGILTLTDQTNSKIYTGTYQLTQTDPQSSIYEVIVDGKEGIAVVAMTAYDDGNQEPTFIINLGDYSINFFAE